MTEEARDYSRSKGVEVEAAETAYDLVGGRILHLRLIADALVGVDKIIHIILPSLLGALSPYIHELVS